MKPSIISIKSIINRSKIEETLLNNEPSNIHFRNGYWSFEDNQFHPRTDVHYITQVINYDLQEDILYDVERLNDVRRCLSIPFSSLDAFDYFCYSVVLSMKNIPANNFYVLLGPGGNGKSSFTSILRVVFEHYCVCLPSACLDSTSDANKSVASIKSDTLFVLIDEIRAKANKHSSLLKKLSDGYLMYNKLYQSGSFEMSTRAKLIINSNSPLSFDDDDDAIRNRIMYMKFNKQFSKSSALPVDNVSVFPAVDNLSATLTSVQKSAIFLFFAMRARQIDISVNVPIPSDILTKNLLVNWKDFVTTHFELRRDCFVSKELVLRLFKDTYPDFEYSSREIIKVYNICYLPTTTCYYQYFILFTKGATRVTIGIQYYL